MISQDRQKFINLYHSSWTSVHKLCSSLSEKEWRLETDCPGWSVKDCLSHLTGIEHRLLGRLVPKHIPTNLSNVRNELGMKNEIDVDIRRKSKPKDVLDEFEEVNNSRMEILANQKNFNDKAISPVGEGTIYDLLSVRTFDCWVHEQDIRRAIGRHGNLTGIVADHAFSRMLEVMPYIVGKKARVEDGLEVSLKITGTIDRSIMLAMQNGRAVETQNSQKADINLSMSPETFLRLCCGRIKPDEALLSSLVDLTGDQEVGLRIVRSMNYMI